MVAFDGLKALKLFVAHWLLATFRHFGKARAHMRFLALSGKSLLAGTWQNR